MYGLHTIINVGGVAGLMLCLFAKLREWRDKRIKEHNCEVVYVKKKYIHANLDILIGTRTLFQLNKNLSFTYFLSFSITPMLVQSREKKGILSNNYYIHCFS